MEEDSSPKTKDFFFLERGVVEQIEKKKVYEFESYLEEGSFDKEEEYHLILEGDKESKELIEAPEREHDYKSPTIPCTS